MKRITVIMGVYNCANTLPMALDSLLEQTYIAKSYVKLYPDYFVLIKNEKNCGLNFTLNKCLKLADTEFVARMDGDDICNSTRFKKEIDFLDNNLQYSFVSSWMDMFDENGVFRTIKYIEKPYKERFVKAPQFCHAGCMIRTDVIKSVGGYSESKKYIRVEDYELWIRLYSNGFVGYNLQESLYSMRDDRNAIYRRNLNARINECRVIYNACRVFHLSPVYYLYVLVPIFKFFFPKKIYTIFHKK